MNYLYANLVAEILYEDLSMLLILKIVLRKIDM